MLLGAFLIMGSIPLLGGTGFPCIIRFTIIASAIEPAFRLEGHVAFPSSQERAGVL